MPSRASRSSVSPPVRTPTLAHFPGRFTTELSWRPTRLSRPSAPMPATTLPGIDMAAVRNAPGVTIGGTGPPRAPTTCTRPSAHAATASCVLPSASATTAPPHAMATDSARPDCQRRTRPSEPRVTTWRSASAKAANVTGPAGPNVESCRDDRTSQMRVTPSSPPATSHRPSRLKLTCSTRVVPPTSVARRLASEALQTWVLPSLEPVANTAPVGLSATLESWPENGCSTCATPLGRDQGNPCPVAVDTQTEPAARIS